MDSETRFAAFIERWLQDIVGVSIAWSIVLKLVILLVVSALLAFVAWWIVRQMLNRVMNRLVKRTTTTFDDHLLDKGVFRKISHIIPVIVFGGLAPVVFMDYPNALPHIRQAASFLNLLFILRAAHAFITALQAFLSQSEKYQDKPIASYTQLAKIVMWLIGGLVLVSIVLGKNPIYMFTALGAVSAVLILVFKDTILGFIASIQLSVNDMVRLGDWVSLPKYGADGDVIEINLTTVKVRNWDNTITTVPTYYFVSDSFKNWRGMQQSGGRRIKRALNLKISSIKLCDEEMLKRYAQIELAQPHIHKKQLEIAAHNEKYEVDVEASIVNGRRMTNIGIFRAYIQNYLARNPNVNQEMTSMVRQLDPTEHGVPLEVYCFSKIKTWVEYEGIQSDIFDHIFAVAPFFDLEIFESPAGSDFQKLAQLKQPS
jgi:miniconductance mechanosensitive channel